jgi:hypothetical protein
MCWAMPLAARFQCLPSKLRNSSTQTLLSGACALTLLLEKPFSRRLTKLPAAMLRPQHMPCLEAQACMRSRHLPSNWPPCAAHKAAASHLAKASSPLEPAAAAGLPMGFDQAGGTVHQPPAGTNKSNPMIDRHHPRPQMLCFFNGWCKGASGALQSRLTPHCTAQPSPRWLRDAPQPGNLNALLKHAVLNIKHQKSVRSLHHTPRGTEAPSATRAWGPNGKCQCLGKRCAKRGFRAQNWPASPQQGCKICSKSGR